MRLCVRAHVCTCRDGGKRRDSTDTFKVPSQADPGTASERVPVIPQFLVREVGGHPKRCGLCCGGMGESLGAGRPVSVPSPSGLPLGVELDEGSFCPEGLSLCPSLSPPHQPRQPCHPGFSVFLENPLRTEASPPCPGAHYSLLLPQMSFQQTKPLLLPCRVGSPNTLGQC